MGRATERAPHIRRSPVREPFEGRWPGVRGGGSGRKPIWEPGVRAAPWADWRGRPVGIRRDSRRDSREFWQVKLDSNVARDAQVNE